MMIYARLSWPDGERWRAFFKFMALFYALFFPFYFGMGHLSSLHSTFALYMPWERDIPLIPWMIWPYLSLFSLFLLPLFHMTAGQIATLSRQSTATLLFAGATFLLFPAHLGYAPVAVEGMHHSLFQLLFMVDTPHNLVPSLHVAFSALILLGCAERASPPLVWTYSFWLLITSASTILVHQHHLLDVFGGLALAIISRRFFPLSPS